MHKSDFDIKVVIPRRQFLSQPLSAPSRCPLLFDTRFGCQRLKAPLLLPLRRGQAHRRLRQLLSVLMYTMVGLPYSGDHLRGASIPTYANPFHHAAHVMLTPPSAFGTPGLPTLSALRVKQSGNALAKVCKASTRRVCHTFRGREGRCCLPNCRELFLVY